MKVFTPAEIQTTLESLPGWSLNPQAEISKTFTCASFAHALMFVSAIGVLAEAAQHHPEILVQYNRITLTLSTHDAKGLTDKDFALAAQINALPNPKAI